MKNVIYTPNVTPDSATCLGEKWFLQKKLWKLAVILGYNWNSGVLTTRGLSISRMLDNTAEVKAITDYLDQHAISYKVEYTEAGYNTVVKVSQSKGVLSAIDELYEEYYISVKRSEMREGILQAVSNGYHKTWKNECLLREN